MNRKKAVSILLASTLISSSFSFTSFAFEDIDNHWASPYIEGLQSEKILTGYGDGNFHPESFISREETAVIIDRAIKIRKAIIEGKTKEFNLSDIYGRWSTESIESLVSKGIIEGYPDGTFKPENNITRQELTAIVYRIINPEAEGETAIEFSDIENQWGESLIKRLTELGIINGYPDGSFKPDEYIKRAEVAKIVYEVINGSDSNGRGLLLTENSEKDDKKPDAENKPGEDKPSSGGSSGSGAYTKKSGVTGIKIKEGSKSAANLGGTEEEPVINVYKSTKDGDDYRLTTFQDVIDEIESADGSEQSYETAAGNSSDSVADDKEIIVKAEDGRTQKNYKINVINRNQDAPENIETAAASTKIAADGKITGVNQKMEYINEKDKAESGAWTSVEGNEIAGLNTGKYYVRYKADESLGLNAGAEKEVSVDYKKSDNTGIKLIENPLTVIKLEGNTITVYKSKAVSENYYEEVTVGEVKSDITTTQTEYDAQTYAVKDSDSSELADDAAISKGKTFVVTAEDGTEKSYNIEFMYRNQDAPKDIEAVSTSSKIAADGKITDVNQKMEYISEKDKAESLAWTSVTGTEITDLSIGKYYVRYKAEESLGLNAGEEKEIDISYKKSNNTDIMKTEGAELVQSIENDTIKMYKAKLENNYYTEAKISDLKNEIKSTVDGDGQKRSVMKGNMELQDDSTVLLDAHTLKVTAEDGTEKTYSIEFINRDQPAPEGVNSIPTSSKIKSDGKITGVNQEMEYISEKDKGESLAWTSVTGTEITDLNAGKYYVRYKANLDLKLNAGEEKEIEVDYTKMSNTKIKLVENPQVVKELENDKIILYKSKINLYNKEYEKAKVMDIKNDITSTQTYDSQTYILKDSKSSELGDLSYITEAKTLVIKAEDGTEKVYNIEFTDRDQSAPENLKAKNKTAKEGGKITGVNQKMEYISEKDKAESGAWTSVEGTEITGLDVGKYYIRYTADSELGFKSGEETEIEIKYEKSSNVSLKKKRDAKFVVGIIGKTIKLKETVEGEKIRATDLKNDFETVEGENQTLQVVSNNTVAAVDVDDNAELTERNCLKVTAENGNSTLYSLQFE